MRAPSDAEHTSPSGQRRRRRAVRRITPARLDAGWAGVERACRVHLAAVLEEEAWNQPMRSEVDERTAADMAERRALLRIGHRARLHLAHDPVLDHVAADAEDATAEGFVRVLEEWPDDQAEVMTAWHLRAREECYRTRRRAMSRRDIAAGLVSSTAEGRAWEALPADQVTAGLRRGEHGERVWEAAAAPGVLRGTVTEPANPEAITVDVAAAAFILGQLSPVEQTVVLGRAEGLTYEEVGHRMGRSRTYARNVLAAVRKRLQDIQNGLAGTVVGWWRRTAPDRWRAKDICASTARRLADLGLTPAAQLAGVAFVVATTGGFANPGPLDGVAVSAGQRTPTVTAAARTLPPVHRHAGLTPSLLGAAEIPGAPALSVPARAPSAPPLPLVSGHEETPADTQLEAAAPAPDYPSSHTVIALGYGHTCQCTVLLRTTDGGGTWEAHNAAPGADQVVVPPAYPRDPRIFLGTAPSSGVPPYVVPDFNALPLPLPAPPGHVALSAGFSSGDPRVFIAGQQALSTVDMPTLQAAVVMTYPGAIGQAFLATAPANDGVAAYVAVPASRTGPAPGLYACGLAASTTCSQRSSLSPLTDLVAGTASPDRGILLALGSGTAHESLDGGRTWTTLPVPAGSALGPTASLADGQLWATLSGAGDQRAQVSVLDITTLQWRQGVQPGRTEDGEVVALSGNTALDLLSTGMVCTVDGGRTWATRCAAGG